MLYFSREVLQIIVDIRILWLYSVTYTGEEEGY